MTHITHRRQEGVKDISWGRYQHVSRCDFKETCFSKQVEHNKLYSLCIQNNDRARTSRYISLRVFLPSTQNLQKETPKKKDYNIKDIICFSAMQTLRSWECQSQIICCSIQRVKTAEMLWQPVQERWQSIARWVGTYVSRLEKRPLTIPKSHHHILEKWVFCFIFIISFSFLPTSMVPRSRNPPKSQRLVPRYLGTSLKKLGTTGTAKENQTQLPLWNTKNRISSTNPLQINLGCPSGTSRARVKGRHWRPKSWLGPWEIYLTLLTRDFVV